LRTTSAVIRRTAAAYATKPTDRAAGGERVPDRAVTVIEPVAGDSAAVAVLDIGRAHHQQQTESAGAT
jgi:hypothetical protein